VFYEFHRAVGRESGDAQFRTQAAYALGVEAVDDGHAGTGRVVLESVREAVFEQQGVARSDVGFRRRDLLEVSAQKRVDRMQAAADADRWNRVFQCPGEEPGLRSVAGFVCADALAAREKQPLGAELARPSHRITGGARNQDRAHAERFEQRCPVPGERVARLFVGLGVGAAERDGDAPPAGGGVRHVR